MRERALRFGEATTLIGILSQPEPGVESKELGVIFLNSGILHRVGASRLYVRTARALAEQGFTSLRFDFSGVGDSESRRDNLQFEAAAIAEAREAMDYLQSHFDFGRFLVIGLCSGADMGFEVAKIDDRVVGLAQMDGYSYPTFQYYVRHYLPKLLSPAQWRQTIGARLQRFAGAVPDSGDETIYEDPEYRRIYPPREEVEAALARLTARSVHLYFFFSGEEGACYNYRGQYEDTFTAVDFGGRLQVDFEKDADHIITRLEHQEAVVASLVRWAQRAADDAGSGAPTRQPADEPALTA